MESFKLLKTQEIIGDAELLEWQDDILHSEEGREFQAKELELNPNTDWETIVKKKDEIYLNKLKKALGLDPKTTSKELFEEEEMRGVLAKGHLVGGLDLNYDATPKEIEAAEEKKRKENIEKIRLIFEHMRANRARNVTPKKFI